MLTVYDEKKESHDIYVFVINVENMFRFLGELNLGLKQLVFIPYPSYNLKKVSDIIRCKFKIRQLINENFLSFSNAEIFFFSRFEDWLTAAFVVAMARKNKVTYLDHYDFSANVFSKRRRSIRTCVLGSIYQYVTSAHFKMNIVEKLPEFNYKRYGIIRKDAGINPLVYSKYTYRFGENHGSKRRVLYFVSPMHKMIYEDSHDNIQLKIIKALKENGWEIIVKGHPRLGISENVLDLVDIEIPAYIPAEFMSTKGVDMYLGIITVSTAFFARNTSIPTYSLVHLFKFINDKLAGQHKQFLSEASADKILFFNNFQDFLETIQMPKLI